MEKERSPKKTEDIKMKLQLPLMIESKQKSDAVGSKSEAVKRKKAKPADGSPAKEPVLAQTPTETSKPSTAASPKVKKVQKGTTKQRLANKLKIRKLIPM